MSSKARAGQGARVTSLILKRTLHCAAQAMDRAELERRRMPARPIAADDQMRAQVKTCLFRQIKRRALRANNQAHVLEPRRARELNIRFQPDIRQPWLTIGK